jgi:hypothetical protein
MSEHKYDEILAGLKSGKIVPYLGPAALKGAVNIETNMPIPADSDSLILAMNNGQPMAPKLMYEFPRAAMNLELKRGRSFVTKFLNQLYGETTWSRAPLHDWLAKLKPQYVIDINRDTQLQDSYADTPHTLIIGLARVGGTDYRFKIFNYDGENYTEVDQSDVDPTKPILFKPMGTPHPEGHYIASDADYVDYITELMGGFAIPSFLKEYRKNKQYLLFGVRLNRDTERMVLSDMVYSADEPTGWALIPDASKKEQRFCGKLGIEIIDMDVASFIETVSGEDIYAEAKTESQLVGC